MGLLMQYLDAFGVLDKISFDMSLARGLDYYTGVIYEVVTEGSAPVATTNWRSGRSKSNDQPKKTKRLTPMKTVPTTLPWVWAVSLLEGRYDNLVERFLPKAQMPCVGVSFGVDRIFSITKARMEREKTIESLRANETDVYVMAFGGKGFDGYASPAHANLQVTLGCRSEGRVQLQAQTQVTCRQFKAAEQGSVPLAVILGEDEQARGMVKVKEMGLPEGHPEKDGVLVPIDDLVAQVKKRLSMKTKPVVPDIVEQVADMTVADSQPDKKE